MINKLCIFKDIFCYVCLHGGVCFPCRHEDLSSAPKMQIFQKAQCGGECSVLPELGRQRQEDLRSSLVSQASQIGEFHGH